MHLAVSRDWFWRFFWILVYCFFFYGIVRTGINPGPKDSKKMVDRVIRVAGGIFIITAFLVIFLVFNWPVK